MNYFSFLKVLLCATVIFLPVLVKCQVCDGSFGDPAVKITFGEGNVGASAYVPTSGYTYQTQDCPNDGFYTITSATANCYGSTWHTLSKDHTGKGNFMLVNASIEPGDFFLTSVTDLCPNTTYEFSAWICNVMRPYGSIRPDVVFTIEQPDGTILGTYDTGPVDVTSSPQWVKYGLFFTTPANNATIVLRMRNNSPGGYGNDLALDDISFSPCGPIVTAAIQNNADTVSLCEGNTASTFSFSGAASSLYHSPVYHWQISINEGISWQDIAGADDTSFLRLPTPAPGKYWYRLTVVDSAVSIIASCRVASNLLKITVHPLPVVDAGPDRIYVKNFPVTLNAVATGEDISFMWTPASYLSDPFIVNPVASPPGEMQYTLSAQSAFNCKNEDNVLIKVADAVYVPTAFTPNGDGLNDYWRIPFLDTGLNADVKVFNRWGALVYHVNAAPVSWDGKLKATLQPSGTYVYLITFRDNKLPTLKGTFTLIR